MPGTQPRGTHAFDPAGSSSQSAMQMLDIFNTEEDRAEDQVGPLLNSSMANMPAAPASTVSPLVSPDLGPSIVSSLSPSDPGTSSSGSTRPPPSSSLLPTVGPHLTQRCDISMGSVATSSEASSSQLRKRKYDARSTSGMQPPSSKQASRNKTDSINPVIMANTLNLTINRMVDMMARTFDAPTVTAAAPPSTTSVAPPSIVTSPIEFLTTSLSSAPSQPLSAPASSTEILDQAVRIISVNNGALTDDELFAASLFFTSASEDAVRTARTFITLGDKNQSVQYRFLLRQLDTAGLLPGRGKAKAAEDGDDISILY